MKPEPHQYVKGKFGIGDLKTLVEANQVRHRGVPFPILAKGNNSNYYPHDTYLESFAQLGNYYLSAFRFYQSGQIVNYVKMAEDPTDDGSEPSSHTLSRKRDLSPQACIYQLTEIFLFASRLSTHGVFGDRANIQFKLHNLKGRVLTDKESRHFSFSGEHTCHTNSISRCYQKTPAELQTEHDDLALDACVEILEHFDFESKYAREGLKNEQQDLYSRTF